jgi:pyruvate dehydrogenase (quinone)
MAKNVAQVMLERLSEWGVKRIYGYPGDGINALTGAFHEVGVCIGTSGPCAIHLLNGLYDAKLELL